MRVKRFLSSRWSAALVQLISTIEEAEVAVSPPSLSHSLSPFFTPQKGEIIGFFPTNNASPLSLINQAGSGHGVVRSERQEERKNRKRERRSDGVWRSGGFFPTLLFGIDANTNDFSERD